MGQAVTGWRVWWTAVALGAALGCGGTAPAVARDGAPGGDPPVADARVEADAASPGSQASDAPPDGAPAASVGEGASAPAAKPTPTVPPPEVVVGPPPQVPAPMVVLLHGLGDTPERFVRALGELPGVRLVALRGPHPWTEGTGWFAGSVRELPAAALSEAARAEAATVVARIDALTARFPTEGKPVVTGFSQGAILSWTLAVTAPDRIAGAVPVAGFLPEGLFPQSGASVAPVRALHGTFDKVLPVARAAAAERAVQAVGGDVTLTIYPAPHNVPDEARAAWIAAVRGLLER